MKHGGLPVEEEGVLGNLGEAVGHGPGAGREGRAGVGGGAVGRLREGSGWAGGGWVMHAPVVVPVDDHDCHVRVVDEQFPDLPQRSGSETDHAAIGGARRLGRAATAERPNGQEVS